MGAIQSSINQFWSVGAFLTQQSETLRARVAERKETRQLAKQEEAINKQIGAISEANEQIQKKERSIDKRIKSLTQGEEFSERKFKNLEKDVGESLSLRAANIETNVELAKRAEKVYERQFELNPSTEALENVQLAKGGRIYAENIGELSNKMANIRTDILSKYKAQAAQALNDRRQEMGDLPEFSIGGERIPKGTPLYEKVAEQYRKENM